MKSLASFKFFNNKSPAYINVFKQTGHPNTNSRASFLKLVQILRKTNYEQNTLSPNIWKKPFDFLKGAKDRNTCKHKAKKHFCDRMKNKESNISSYF